MHISVYQYYRLVWSVAMVTGQEWLSTSLPSFVTRTLSSSLIPHPASLIWHTHAHTHIGHTHTGPVPVLNSGFCDYNNLGIKIAEQNVMHKTFHILTWFCEQPEKRSCYDYTRRAAPSMAHSRWPPNYLYNQRQLCRVRIGHHEFSGASVAPMEK